MNKEDQVGFDKLKPEIKEKSGASVTLSTIYSEIILNSLRSGC
jgi:hypothetical protein